ncbi:hypothetical protein DVH24_006627 [Malus domestica]|uniref:Uncharacterized protein n=1 Tax=Malus domestica TaxID=3750 RepID=A0A498KAK3_MALDO|nr:hypothetical protein DVH24_006627 [Malus domestica]
MTAKWVELLDTGQGFTLIADKPDDCITILPTAHLPPIKNTIIFIPRRNAATAIIMLLGDSENYEQKQNMGMYIHANVHHPPDFFVKLP